MAGREGGREGGGGGGGGRGGGGERERERERERESGSESNVVEKGRKAICIIIRLSQRNRML